LFWYEGKRRPVEVHRLVARAFVPGYFEGATVDHLDGDKTNNAASNLEWVTRSENTRRQHRDGRGAGKGDAHPNAKLRAKDIPEIFKLRREGWTFKQIGQKYGVSLSLIHKIISGVNWPGESDKWG
jgi:hypothetical protein